MAFPKYVREKGALSLEEPVRTLTSRQADLSTLRVLSFNASTPMGWCGLAEPALALTPPAVARLEHDGLLTASEVALLKLNADWVVLSACNTAAPDGSAVAEGLAGLGKAFFYAEARSLLVSHWPVETNAAVALTTGAFQALEQDPGMGRSEALRRSMLALMGTARFDSQNAHLAHPILWAPFVLVGEAAQAGSGYYRD